MFYIYSITNILNGKKYIGQSSDPDKRYKAHLTNSSNSELKEDIKVHGSSLFEFEILDETEDPIDINYKEISYIEDFDPSKLYNCVSGGQLVNGSDSYICDICGEIKSSKFSYENKKEPYLREAGLILFRIEECSRLLQAIKFICHNCKMHDKGLSLCEDRETYPLSKILSQTALMDLVMNYNIPENIINSLIIVNGKLNIKMAYAYFTKRLGWT